MPRTDRQSLEGNQNQHSNFQSRTATDDGGEFNRRWTPLNEGQVSPSPDQQLHAGESSTNPYEPATNDSTPPPREHSFTKRLLHLQPNDGIEQTGTVRRRSSSGRRKIQSATLGEDSVMAELHNGAESKKADGEAPAPKPGLGPRPIGGDEKLGLFSGVYVPTCLNVLSILMFLRFGFILGLCHTIPAWNPLLTKS